MIFINQLDIRQKIDQNNRLIEQLLTPNRFTLNNAVYKLLNENDELQKKCVHTYENGFCIYCDKEQPEE